MLSISYHCAQQYNFLGPWVLPCHDVCSHSDLDGTGAYGYRRTLLKEKNCDLNNRQVYIVVRDTSRMELFI